MSTPDTTSPARSGGVKTLAIRLEPELHQQLSALAQLLGSTITDEIRTAIDERITAVKTRPDLVAKADTALADIDRDAAQRRSTIAALFTSDDSAPVAPPLSVDPDAAPGAATTGVPGGRRRAPRKTAASKQAGTA